MSDHYSLGGLGSISKHRPSKAWYRLASPVINKSIPWLDTLLNDMVELNPDEGAISYMDGIGGEHIDLPDWPTAINYIFYNTDDTAYSWVTDSTVQETYPSVVNTAWLLNTQQLHGIKNAGERWALSIHFNDKYQKVKEWFDNHPNLKYGNNITGEQ